MSHICPILTSRTLYLDNFSISLTEVFLSDRIDIILSFCSPFWSGLSNLALLPILMCSFQQCQWRFVTYSIPKLKLPWQRVISRWLEERTFSIGQEGALKDIFILSVHGLCNRSFSFATRLKIFRWYGMLLQTVGRTLRSTRGHCRTFLGLECRVYNNTPKFWSIFSLYNNTRQPQFSLSQLIK